ncbi:NADP-reducing hydrogenase subunit HndA [bacterium BMS3Abin09]|nr:NADP-reducing hydrogenase subunit HndA [bacterium BMS3Abin09]GBE40413.1 NADP-reducing hydrogenase subunit HndA [bacterium BMS3Bbin09]HDH34033.1 NAD(P)H-dependent oxidoreductase subunit E [Nitrospirota bacterium]
MSLNLNEVFGGIGEVLSEEQKQRGILIHAFQQIQEEHNYLPQEEIEKLSKELDLPMSFIFSTATFYKQFYFTPRGKKILRICTGTACHVRGADKVLHSLEDEFNVKEGETTADLSMTLETVGCIGCCGLAPVATVNENIVGEIDAKKLDLIVDNINNDTALTSDDE